MKFNSFVFLFAFILAGCQSPTKPSSPVSAPIPAIIPSNLNPANAVPLAMMSRAKPLVIIQPPPAVTLLSAADAIVTWTNATPGAFSIVYYGTNSRAYDHMIPVGTNTTKDVVGLDVWTTYFFAVTDYLIDGPESDFSAEAIYTNRQRIEMTFNFPNPVASPVIQSSSDLIQWNAADVTPVNATDQTVTVRAVADQPAAFFRAVSVAP